MFQFFLIHFHLFLNEFLNAVSYIRILFNGVLAATLLQDIVWYIGVKNFSVIVLRVILDLRLGDIVIQANLRASNPCGSVCYPLFRFRLC